MLRIKTIKVKRGANRKKRKSIAWHSITVKKALLMRLSGINC
jgi:hypothetical protein